MTGHACPECGRGLAGQQPVTGQAPPGPRGGPDGCVCGAGAARLTGEERRAARAAETAAAEDFDPLRIRPYVQLGGDGTAPGRRGSGAARDGGRDRGHGEGHEAATGPGPDDARRYGAGPGPVQGRAAPGTADTTMPLFPDTGMPRFPAGAPMEGAAYEAGRGAAYGDMDATAAQPRYAGGPDGANRRTATFGAVTGPGIDPDADPVQPRRRGPFTVLAVGVAVAAVVGIAAFAGGLFRGDDNQDEALPETAASAPYAGGGPAASVSESAAASPSPSRSARVSPSASATGSASPSGSAEPTRSASASASPATPAPSLSAATKTPGAPSAAPPAQLTGPTLRPGDHGPEVAELQNRLKEVWLYQGPSNADYTDRVEEAVQVYQSYKAIRGDPAGVYGPNTRRALEAETSGRGGH
ncbi:peptidoglycan-binding domain-containing protein [Streptomyces sp. NBC_01237]|uniref:peptidoglycan-binding domain-containing protein n=1 Tax=Streptomyces sp. NBC_01237 TaxID=2903790 RepID=UPI002DD8B680|nr:peptidoglycan-binding domain-containing protein [Streptomyces sp. NBC_01237]WRZ72167.1 peptidoglycan-binding protein [Streptomyces sp. NBC_01237]